MQLQKDITALHHWSVTNKMVFHPNKCKVLTVTLKNVDPILPFDRFGYHLNGECLDYVWSQKDLGVHMTTKLHWGPHCKSLVTKARSRLGLVSRTLHFVNNRRQKRVFYLSLVRSIFEHCSVVWRPQHKTDITELSMLQKRAVKWILSEQTASYSDREYLLKQNQLDILPINSRLCLTDLVLFHQIVYKLVFIEMPSYLLLKSPEVVRNRAPTNQIGNQATFSTNINEANIIAPSDFLQFRCSLTPKVDAFKHSFFYRVHKDWNYLPLTLRGTQDPKDFKCLLKEHMWKVLLEKPD